MPENNLELEVLQQFLVQVIEAATKSAEGSTASAAAVSQMNHELTALKDTVMQHGNDATNEIKALKSEVKSLKGAISRINDASAADLREKQDTRKWLQSLLTPQTAYYTVLIIAASLGIKSTLPIPVPGSELSADQIELRTGSSSPTTERHK